MGVLETFIRVMGIAAYYIYNTIREFLFAAIVLVGNMYLTLTWIIQANGAQAAGTLDPWFYNIGLLIIWGLWVMFMLMLDNVITRFAMSDSADTTVGRVTRFVSQAQGPEQETNETQPEEPKQE